MYENIIKLRKLGKSYEICYSWFALRAWFLSSRRAAGGWLNLLMCWAGNAHSCAPLGYCEDGVDGVVEGLALIALRYCLCYCIAI